jgi:transcriptional regulator with XRE-family HTH domain
VPKIKKNPDTFEGHLGAAVRTARISASLSQEEVADATVIPLTNLGRIERGARHTTIRELSAIAAVTSTTPAAIASAALEKFGGGSVDGGLERLMSEVRGTTNDIEEQQKKRAAAMTPEQLEAVEKIAATRDAELLEDEPPAP